LIYLFHVLPTVKVLDWQLYFHTNCVQFFSNSA